MDFANHYSKLYQPYSIKNPEVDRDLVLKIICIFESNKLLGGSVAIKNAMINHSCCANAFSYNNYGKMEVRATHKIKKGEEITLSYDVHWQCIMKNWNERQQLIRAEYGFTCRCELCQDELFTDDEESYARFRTIMEKKEILDNIIEFENGTMEKYIGESQKEYKNRCYGETLKSIEKSHNCFTQMYNLCRNKKATQRLH